MIVGILLAAGRGLRFDPSGVQDKLLQPLPDGATVAEASARHLLNVVPRVIAVVSPADRGVAAVLRALGCDVTVCPAADTGMGASLAHAVAASLTEPQPHAWLIALGDMPFVEVATLQALCAALDSGAAIAAPMFQGRRGNPVGFGTAHRDALLALTGEEGARRIVRASVVVEVDVDDPGIVRDVDTRADL
ncbi:MAG: nucleotidyltransferase family protein [Pseudomonadota bacterium]|nr:nucleotidyltransferase family protein [Pseudomonadota bacterium]